MLCNAKIVEALVSFVVMFTTKDARLTKKTLVLWRCTGYSRSSSTNLSPRKNMRILTLLSLSAFLLSCCGCGGGGGKVPDELRNLAPVSVTVKNGDQPMAGIQVILFAKSGGAFACNGVTGTDGTAQIQSSRSSYTGKGAPAGIYTVVLSEPIEVPEELISQESDQNLPPTAQAEKSRKLNEFLSRNQKMPSALTTGASPIELTVADKTGATLTVDITQYK